MSDDPKRRETPVPAGRFARLARLGAMTAGVAGDMALSGARSFGRGERPRMRDLLLTPRNVGRIADDLAKMRGAAMKVGQLLSMDAGDALPPELAEIMGRLRSDAEAMPGPQLKAALDRNWGPDWRKRFERFDVRPIAAASIGQVHRAVLKDGRELAIKVQYPGVARSIDSDVANLGALLRMTGLVPKGLDLAPYLEEARRQLHEEADYEREGARLVEYRRLIEDEPGFVAPELVENLTTKEILAMTYLPGAPIERSEDADQATRDRIASRLIDLSLRELFEFRLMQTDSNFANFRYDAERDRIVLLDFGATRALDPQFVEDCRALLSAGLAEDRAGTRAACERLDILHEATAPAHRERIFAMVETAFEALRRDEVFDFAASDLSRRLQAEGEALALEEPTPPPVPMDALYVQRKLGGMFLLATRLRARAPVRAMLARWVEGTAAQAAE